MISAAVISGSPPSGIRSLSTISASVRSTSCRLRLANAVTRISAPSSSRMLVWILRGDELQHVRRRGQPVHGGLLAQDRDAGLEVGRLDVGDQAPLEPVAQPVLERLEPLGRPVGGEHDLLVGVVEGVEGVEELLLGLDLALQELDVVDQQHVDVAVAALEPVLPVVADRVDELVGELLAGHVADLGAGVEAAHVVADGVQQVGLAQAGVAVDQQRVVGLARRLGDRDRGRVREPVGRADDEGLEGVLRVEPGLERGRRARAARRLRPRAAARAQGTVDDRPRCGFVDMSTLSTCRASADRHGSERRRLVDGADASPPSSSRVDGDRDPDLATEGAR